MSDHPTIPSHHPTGMGQPYSSSRSSHPTHPLRGGDGTGRKGRPGVQIRRTAARQNALAYAAGEKNTQLPPTCVSGPLLVAGYLVPDHREGERAFRLTAAGERLLADWRAR